MPPKRQIPCHTTRLASLVAVALLALGGAPAHAEADHSAHPINCATAEGDIRALNSEKHYAEDQKLRDVASVTPAGALIGIATGTEAKRLEMLTGEYSKKIDARIAAIKAACGS